MLAAALVVIKNLPPPGEPEPEFESGGYLTSFGMADVTAVRVTLPDDEFTITQSGGEFAVDDAYTYSRDYMAQTVAYAASLPYFKRVGDGVIDSDTSVEINGVTVQIGDYTPDGEAAYVSCGGVTYLCGAEIVFQLTLPKAAYAERMFWNDDSSDRPALNEVTLSSGGETLWSLRRSETGADAIGGAQFRLVYPAEFLTSDERVYSAALGGINDIDFDEIAENAAFEELFELYLSGEGGFERRLLIGGEAPGGGRYVKLKDADTVYTDMLGGYAFLNARPLDFAYGVLFLPYSFQNCSALEIDGADFPLGEETRRLFKAAVNISVSGEFSGEFGDKIMSIKLTDVSGTHTLDLYDYGAARSYAAVLDGTAMFTCNVKDIEAVRDEMPGS